MLNFIKILKEKYKIEKIKIGIKIIFMLYMRSSFMTLNRVSEKIINKIPVKNIINLDL